MNYEVDTTAARLSGSLDTMLWALAQVPEEWRHRPLQKDGWDIAQNLAHMAVYEELMVVPVLEDVLAGGIGNIVPSGGEDWFDVETANLAAKPIDEIVGHLSSARKRQVDAVLAYTPERFNECIIPLWSAVLPHSAGWVATKTFQHTWEHGNFILQVALFHPLFDARQ